MAFGRRSLICVSRWGGIVIARCHQPCSSWAWRWPRMKMLGWEKMIRRIVRVWIQLFFNRAHRSSTSNSTSSSSVSYTSTHFIAMREPQRRFQAFFVGKVKYFFTKTIFFVDSLAPYVHFHKENGFPFTRKPWVGTGFLGDSNTSIYSMYSHSPRSGGLRFHSCVF